MSGSKMPRSSRKDNLRYTARDLHPLKRKNRKKNKGWRDGSGHTLCSSGELIEFPAFVSEGSLLSVTLGLRDSIPTQTNVHTTYFI